MRDAFFTLVERATAELRADEVLLAYFVGEDSDFVRFNRARVRQPMTIRQRHVTLSLVRGKKRDVVTVTLSSQPEEDLARASFAIRTMREALSGIPDDPYLLYSTEASSSHRSADGRLPSPEEALDFILEAAKGTDLVGLYASGPVARGFASSLGHRHFHEVASFQFDFSLYHSADKAVNRSYATSAWNPDALRQRIDAARAELEHMQLPARAIEPGTYRAYLAPDAVAELVQMLNWGGVSAKAQRTKTSCIQKLADGEAHLADAVTLSEHTAGGFAPAFDEAGFGKPGKVDLVVGGRHANAMVSARTAREYGIASNGAEPEETLRSAELDAGTLETRDVLAALDTGIYVGNLWYLNFSDRMSARITGMTRFATFWVERGRIVAPLSVMRFDDTLYRMLGDRLEALTAERQMTLSTNTYGQRSVETTNLPGALIREVAFTL